MLAHQFFVKFGLSTSNRSVYIGFGSIVVSDPDLITRTVMEAVKEADVWAVISKGWSDRALIVEESANTEPPDAMMDVLRSSMSHESIYSIPSVPHDWLFPQVDAVCHHGFVLPR